MWTASCWLTVTYVIWILISGVLSEETLSTTTETPNNCYARAVYEELIKVIEIVKDHTYKDNDTTSRRPTTTPLKWKKLQDEEDYGIETPFEFGGSIVPTIFKLVGSAIALNSSGLSEGSFGLLPESVSVRITSVLGTLANSILGPGVIPTTRPPTRRRRRTTTTTTVATTTEAITEKSSTTGISTEPEPDATDSSSSKVNVSSLPDAVGEDLVDPINGTSTFEHENATEEMPTATDVEVLFKESSLGELPVYAAAYAPNYVAATTPYPVYANNFLHSLYSAPTTTTIPTTTTAGTTTSTDPNSYAIALPFDYQEPMGTGTGPIGVNKEDNFTEAGFPSVVLNTTYPPLLQQTPPEYGSEYEYEEQTDEAVVARYRDNEISKSVHVPKEPYPRTVQSKSDGDDDEYVDNDDNSNRSLGRISRHLYSGK